MRQGLLRGLRPDDLDLDATLASGQVFRWRRETDGSWYGMVGERRLVLQGDRNAGTLRWQADGADPEAAVRRFLRLDDLDLPAMVAGWSATNPGFAGAAQRFPGLRIVRQDRLECVFCFLLASAAPVARISAMAWAVVRAAGGNPEDPFVPFPELDALARIPEADLRAAGLGFRAPRIVAAARHLAGDPDCLERIAVGDRAAVHALLCSLPGAGPKISDCAALFAFDCDDAVPVDVHIWRITQTLVAPELAGKSLTAANYQRARDAWIERYGAHAGWAQQILFHDAARKAAGAK
ncbi:MAG: DNA glycosylase [Armatimonadota bacterium]